MYHHTLILISALTLGACDSQPDAPPPPNGGDAAPPQEQAASPEEQARLDRPDAEPPPRPEPVPAPDDVAAAPEDAKKTESGLAWKTLEPGTGTEKPGPTDKVKVHYTGWTTDGKMFDSSVVRGTPATFPLNRVIPGWTEGLQLMTVGEKARLWIPEELAYRGQPGKPAGMLVFDVELLAVEK